MQAFFLSWKFFVFISVIFAFQGYILGENFSWSVSVFFGLSALYKGIFYLKNIDSISGWVEKLFCLTFGVVIMTTCAFGLIELSAISVSDIKGQIFTIGGYVLSIIAFLFGLVLITVGLVSRPYVAARFLKKIFSPMQNQNISIW